MELEMGEIITLDSNGKDYIVMKTIKNENKDYYYLMTKQKPAEVLLVKMQYENGEPILTTITDENEFRRIMEKTHQVTKS